MDNKLIKQLQEQDLFPSANKKEIEDRRQKFYKENHTCPSCGQHKSRPPHSCPYQEDINGNEDPQYCICCPDCEHDCIMEI